jgi:hypothetical protein
MPWKDKNVAKAKHKQYRIVHIERVRELSRQSAIRNRTKIGNRFNSAKSKAKQRKKEWTLTLQEYAALVSVPCFYCGGLLGQVTRSSGLDRLDSSKGYFLGNCVSCCGICNRIKGDNLTADETRALVSLLIRLRGLNA